ncbi:hypothetical protein U0070_007635 [Myodes glareolus]|uniref:Uncharacterized protein n=1 Tax=Myodes glareolus TaxID=447135 RepID=A0AAW0J0E1_MYOGA
MRPPPVRARLPRTLMLLAALLATGRGLPLRKRGPGPHSRMLEWPCFLGPVDPFLTLSELHLQPHLPEKSCRAERGPPER